MNKDLKERFSELFFQKVEMYGAGVWPQDAFDDLIEEVFESGKRKYNNKKLKKVNKS